MLVFGVSGRLRGEAWTWGICEVFAMHCGSIVGLKCRVRKSLCLCCGKNLESHLQCLKDATGGWDGVSGESVKWLQCILAALVALKCRVGGELYIAKSPG